jgi:CarD family transcriptional regulator
MIFEIGEKVVYSNQGIGTIENISSRSFGAQCERFYLLRLAYNSLTVMIPFSNVSSIGIRKITKNNEICRILAFLANGAPPSSCSDWKGRFKENTERMQSGNLLQVAQVLKSLLLLQHEKPLSFREKRMLDRARFMLISEISTARRVTESEAVLLLQRALGKASLSLPPAL